MSAGTESRDIGRLRVCCFPHRMAENAFLSLLYEPLEARGAQLFAYDWFLSNFRRADLFHVHWPDAVVMGTSLGRTMAKFVAFLLTVQIYRLRGIPVIYHVHNIRSHDNSFPRIEAWLWRLFLPRVALFIHMNGQSIVDFVTHWPATTGQRHVVLSPPSYAPAPGALDPESARAQFGLPRTGPILACFGLLRPYKGIENLIAAFANLDRPEATLVIAGRPFDSDYGARLEELCAADPRIRFLPRFLSEAELDQLIRACDFVVMAHQKVNNSGVALLSLSRGRRLLGPRLGALPELRRQLGADWLMLFDRLDPSVLTEALDTPAPAGKPDLSAFDPSVVSSKLGELYLSAARGGRAAQDMGKTQDCPQP